MKLSAVFLAACLSCAHAQDEIESSRPNLAEPSNVVGKGVVQLETGLLLERDRGGAGRERTLSMPTMLRFGVSEQLELRIESDARTIRHTVEDGRRSTEAGYADTALGFSWHALDAAGGLPSVAVLLSADVDTGSRAFRGQGVRPNLRVAAEWDLPNEMSFGLMPGVGVERDASGRYRYGILAAIVEKPLGERLSGFAEVALPQIARGRHGGTEATFDIGGAYLLSKDIQLDAMFSRGLNSRTPDYAFTFGISIRR
ncbi:transporter [Massilia sp. G4R7]|uniref:Transporter n=1 Tax=Massilia phyllostachyos TaxID=2898585 RepID=A0ABS8Q311_9BURK|nr:transporter [Massilia phyllostachyos]MCD2516124.1 transporter [Massilia phyllostachyos]